jgi:hypothetical protein
MSPYGAEPYFEQMYQSSRYSQTLVWMTPPLSGSLFEQKIESSHSDEKHNYILYSLHIRDLPEQYLVPKDSGGTLCISIMPKFSSSAREALLDLIRVATKQSFILYIQLLDSCERHPSLENPNHSQNALIEVLYRIEKWKNRYKMVRRPNSDLGSFSLRTLGIPSNDGPANNI